MKSKINQKELDELMRDLRAVSKLPFSLNRTINGWYLSQSPFRLTAQDLSKREIKHVIKAFTSFFTTPSDIL